MGESSGRMVLRAAPLLAVLAVAPACATRECPPCRSLVVEMAGHADTTLPYTLEMEGPIRCDVISSFGEPERLRCYCVDTTVSHGSLATSDDGAH